MEILEFKSKFIDDLISLANSNSTDVADEFLNLSLEYLESSETVIDPKVYFLDKVLSKNKKARFDGYSIDDSESSITFFVTEFSIGNEQMLTNSKVQESVSRIINFLDELYDGDLSKFFDDSDDLFIFSPSLKYRLTSNNDDQLNKIKIIVVTSMQISSQYSSKNDIFYRGKKLETIVWSIDTFFELAKSKSGKIAVTINTLDYGLDGLHCLKADIKSNDFDSYLAVIPGDFLAEIYLKHGSRLLEGNVRSFLSFKGKINKGIKTTINTEPTRFFPYNNGISTTAEEVTVVKDKDGLKIVSIKDLQIINGGQTTASIAAVKINSKEKINLTNVFIQMKLTVIKNRENYDELVKNISQFANSQNKVSDADFFSNHPFHRTIEDLSNVLSNLPNNNGISTYWFYERSRGKYLQEQMKMTKSQVISWQKRYPPQQVLTKEQFAKYINSINCKPDVVSGGLQSSFKHFALEIGKSEDYEKTKHTINEIYFKRAIAAAIIFKATDKIVQNLDWYVKGGYKANIITYTIAKIIDSIPKDYELDYLSIWKKQNISEELSNEIIRFAKTTNEFIVDSNGIIVTEYCKKPETWDKFKKINISISKELTKQLVKKSESNKIINESKQNAKEQALLNVEIEVVKLGKDVWFNILEKGKELNLLSDKDRSLIKILLDDGIPSRKQAILLLEIKNKIEEEGYFFKPSNEE